MAVLAGLWLGGCDLAAAYRSAESLAATDGLGVGGDGGLDGDLTVSDVTPGDDGATSDCPEGPRKVVASAELLDVAVAPSGQRIYAVGSIIRPAERGVLIVAFDRCGQPLPGGQYTANPGDVADLRAQSVALVSSQLLCVGGVRVAATGDDPHAWTACYRLDQSGVVSQQLWQDKTSPYSAPVRVAAGDTYLIAASVDSVTTELVLTAYTPQSGLPAKDYAGPPGAELADLLRADGQIYAGLISRDAGPPLPTYSYVATSCDLAACGGGGKVTTGLAIPPPSTGISAFTRGQGYSYWIYNSPAAPQLVVQHDSAFPQAVLRTLSSSLSEVHHAFLHGGQLYLVGSYAGHPALTRSDLSVSSALLPIDRAQGQGQLTSGASIDARSLVFVGALDGDAFIEVCAVDACVQPAP